MPDDVEPTIPALEATPRARYGACVKGEPIRPSAGELLFKFLTRAEFSAFKMLAVTAKCSDRRYLLTAACAPLVFPLKAMSTI